MTQRFTKVLISKHSPENKCFAADGTVLFAPPRPTVPLRPHVSHYFLSSSDGRTRSRYGWVATATEPFTLEEFLDRYVPHDPPSDESINHNRTMLTAASRQGDGTPMAASYSMRGVEQREMEFEVHKVVFFTQPDNG